MRLMQGLILALGLGATLVIGFVNTHTDELMVVVPGVLVTASAFGLIDRRRPWRWGLLLGGAVPVSQLVAYLLGWHVPYPNELKDIPTSMLVLIPAFVGAYVGAGVRTLVTQDRLGASTDS